jgi:hypothetical protein
MTWAHNSFGSVKKELQRLRAKLESVRRASMHSGPTAREKQLMKRISELLSREEIMMKQRSRMDWLKEGDRNTTFFHARARERAQINRITAFEKGGWYRSDQAGRLGNRSYGVLLEVVYATGNARSWTDP